MSTTTPVSTATKSLAKQLAQTEIEAMSDIHPAQRCDRCRVAQAQSRVTLTHTSHVLYLCNHHLRENLDALDVDPNVLIHYRSGTQLT